MINWSDYKTYLFLLLPLFSGYMTSFICRIGKDSGKHIPSRPPSWVYGVVWPILYAFLGLSWIILRSNSTYVIDGLMAFNIILMIMWIILYGCGKNKKGALYVLLVLLISSLMLFGYAWSQDKVSGLLVTPYVAWIIFALMLNYTEVNKGV